MCNICMGVQNFDPARHSSDSPVFPGLNGQTITETTDAAESVATTYAMSVGDTFSGTLESLEDEDWVAITFEAGETYTITLTGGTLDDPYLYLHDANGNLLQQNDDSNGYDSAITFTASSTGTYYIEADAYPGSYGQSRTGTYDIEVTQAQPLPGGTGSVEELGTFLQVGTGGFSRSYDTSSSNVITVNITGLTADGQQLARWAMEAWEMVIDVDFVEVTSGEMITLDDEDSGAFAYYPNAGSTSAGVELNVSRAWLNNSGTTIDSYSFQTYVHEFGHAIGLRHQGNYNGSADYPSDAYFANDSWQMSVMSYFSQTENTSTNASRAFTAGAMMADIWAAQGFYGEAGANSATAGDTVYGRGSNLGNYMDEFFDWFSTGNTSSNVTGNRMAFTIYDQGGTDLLDFGFMSDDIRLDMRPEQFSDFGNNIGIMGIAHNTTVENAITGSGDDEVTGNGADNALTAGGGNDTIAGGAGNDTIAAEDGSDEVMGQAGFDQINSGLGDDLIYGGSQADTVSAGDGNDTVFGGNGRDMVYLNQGNDVFNDNAQDGEFARDIVFGGGGDDTIEGGGGADQFSGNDGRDAINGGVGNDSLFGGNGFDTVFGGEGDDLIFGGNGQDRIYMGAGADRYVDTAQGGDLGQDTITGGSGADTFFFGSVVSNDVITDFELGTDRLELALGLVNGQSAAQVASAAQVTGQGVLLSFGADRSILLEGLNSTSGLSGDIDIV